jgi:hypothetical protein
MTNINKKSIDADTTNILPVSTRKLASLFQSTLKEGCVWAKITAAKAITPPTTARALKIENEANVKQIITSMQRTAARRLLRLFNSDFVAKT